MENTEQTLPDDDARNITWEANHQKITEAMSKLIDDPFRESAPTMTEIAKTTGLSRKTIYAHIREYSDTEAHNKRTEMFDIMKLDVLMRICEKALQGNLKAAKMYLDITGSLKREKKTIDDNTGSTNLEVNGIKLHKGMLQKLSPEQLKQIEDMLRPTFYTGPNTERK